MYFNDKFDSFVHSHFKNVKKTGNNQYMAACPAHNDKDPSLSITLENDNLLLYCFAGCLYDDILNAVNLKNSDLFLNNDNKSHTSKTVQHRNGDVDNSNHVSKKVKQCNSNTNDTSQTSKTLKHCNTKNSDDSNHSSPNTSIGCTLADYAFYKRIPVDYLQGEFGLRDIKINFNREKIDALEVPYLDVDGNRVSSRRRISLFGKDKFRWKTGNRPLLYGLQHLKYAIEVNCVVLVEGESDTHTLMFHGFPALGVPGATNFLDERDAEHFRNIDTIYLLKEPDAGGDKLLNTLANSSLRDKLSIVDLGEHKDPSNLYTKNKKAFKKRFRSYLNSSLSLAEYLSEDEKRRREECYKICETLARKQDILSALISIAPDLGIVGEENLVMLIYLALTTRFFDKPVSLTVKGDSSSGKSFTTDTVITKLFPKDTCIFFSSMSEKALIYDDEDYRHKFILLREDEAAKNEFIQYILRTLLSEGIISHRVTEKDPETNRQGVRKIEKEGPTGLIMTTTKEFLNMENENRTITIYTDSSVAQTQRILLRLADDRPQEVDLKMWVEFQNWLAYNPKSVVIPYAKGLAKLAAFHVVRIRRDFSKILFLIKAHALLHQLNRDRDRKGRIIAVLEDYRVVYELVNDPIAKSIANSIPDSIKSIVNAVKILTVDSGQQESVSVTEIAQFLSVNKATVSRNLKAAGKQNYLKNLEFRKGVEAKWVLGKPISDETKVLPTPDELQEYYKKEYFVRIPHYYSIEQFFWDFDKYLKRRRPSAKEAYRIYMHKCNKLKRSIDNDLENFELEYGIRFEYSDMLIEFEAEQKARKERK